MITVKYIEDKKIKTKACDYVAMDNHQIYLVYNDGNTADNDPLYRTIALNPGSVILEVC